MRDLIIEIVSINEMLKEDNLGVNNDLCFFCVNLTFVQKKEYNICKLRRWAIL